MKAEYAARHFGHLADETAELDVLKLAELKRFVDVGIHAADEWRVKPLTKELMEKIKVRGRQRD